MKPADSPPTPAEPEAEPGYRRGAWLALALLLARSAVVLALELAHHGRPELAGLRLSLAVPGMLVGAFGLALAIVIGTRCAALLVGSRGSRYVMLLPIATATFLLLRGSLDGDPSRRIGLDTRLGLVAAGLAASASMGLALVVTRVARSTRAPARLGVLLPLGLAALWSVGLGFAFGGLSAVMEVKQVEDELVGGSWEVLRAHSEVAPGPGILTPSPQYTPEGAARPALVMPPPALVRRVLPASDAPRWLVGAAGRDHAVVAEAAERYPGHAFRLRVRVNGAIVSEARLPLAKADAWLGFGEGTGLPVPGGARLELESALLDASGIEVRPELPLRAGFGELLLERRELVARTSSSPERPNIVLVVLDTLRADRTSAYGYGPATTPHLAALAARGVLFEEASATASWTWPSTASILTGLYPEEHGVEDIASSFLPEALDTLPEALQRAGFTTAAWSGSPLIVPDKRFDQGFELFDSSSEGHLRRSDIVLPGALDWLGAVRAQRFFLYLHLMEPHAPYVPLEEGRAQFAGDVPRSFDPRAAVQYSWILQREGFSAAGEARTAEVVSPEEQRWISALYDGCVWSADHYLGQLLARLEELDLTASTIVAVTSDHGEELFEHGLLTHAHSLHRELVRVPLVLAGPGLPHGERVRVPVTGAALGPTLARLGGSPLVGPGAESASRLDLLRPEVEAATLFSTRQGWWNGVARQPLFGLRRGATVLHFAPEGRPWGMGEGLAPGEVRLYDLQRDPEERHDLAALEPERARALREELVRRLEGLELRRVPTVGAADAGTLEILRKLGYIDGEH